jgi:hypothetical protein
VARQRTHHGWASGGPGALVPVVERLDFTDQLLGGGLAVAIQHARVVDIKPCVLDAGETGALAAFDGNHVLRAGYFQDRHAIDRRARIGLGHRVKVAGTCGTTMLPKLGTAGIHSL